MRLACTMVVLFMFSLPALAGPCTMAVGAVLPLHPEGDRVLVDASINHQPALLVFDTGAFTSVLTLQAAQRLGMGLTKGEEFDSVRATLSGVGGARNAIGVVARTVDIGGLHGRDYNFLAADILAPPLDGLLSMDLISQFDIDLDYPEHKAILYRPVGDCSAPAAFLASPLYGVALLPTGEDRRPRVTVQIGDKDFVALVDTGTGTTFITRRAAARLGVRLEDLGAARHFTVQGIASRAVAAVRHVFEPISIGDLTLVNKQMDVLDDTADDGVEIVLGADFQRQVHVWISYSSHSMIMQYPPRPSKKAG